MNYDISTQGGMQASVDWFLDFVSHIKDGGVWYIPRSNASYRIDHDRQCITSLEGPRDIPTERVAEAAGWEVFTGLEYAQ